MEMPTEHLNTEDHRVSGRFSDDRITVSATYRDAHLVELTIKALVDRIDVRDVRKLKLTDLEIAYLAGRHQATDPDTDPDTIRELLAIPAYDGSEEWRHTFAKKYALARTTFRNPAARIAEANEMTVGNVHSKVREGRLRGDIPWPAK